MSFDDGQPIGAPDFHEAEQFNLPVIFDESERHLPDVAGGTFSGKIVERDQQLVAAVLGAHAAGIGKKRIGEAFKISPNTVRGIVDRARLAGKIDPYKRRVSDQLGRAIESGMEQWIEAAEAGNIRADQIPVAVGIFSDKKALIDGEATSRVERTVGPSMDDVLEKMKRAKAVIGAEPGPAGLLAAPGDSDDDQSTDFVPDTQQKGDLDSGGVVGGVDAVGAAGRIGADESAGSEADGKGRGGVLLCAPRRWMMGFRQINSDLKAFIWVRANRRQFAGVDPVHQKRRLL